MVEEEELGGRAATRSPTISVASEMADLALNNMYRSNTPVTMNITIATIIPNSRVLNPLSCEVFGVTGVISYRIYLEGFLFNH